MIGVANAPVSYGVFELTIGAPGLPGPEEVLDSVASAGYEGVDLGPPGFLGVGEKLWSAFAERKLALSGGWVPLRLTDREAMEQDLAGLDRILDDFQLLAGLRPDLPARPTLADAGSGERAANPGRGKDFAEIGLNEERWKLLAEGVDRAVQRCRTRGLEPTFHHHTGTYVEAPQEIDRLLELTSIGLCLDTGHLLLGGGDPVQALMDWAGRINHIHLKDASLDVITQVIEERAGMREVWTRGAFRELGAGDLDVDGFISALRAVGYSGWLVVEQDRIPAPGEGLDSAAAQERNRRFLRQRGI